MVVKGKNHKMAGEMEQSFCVKIAGVAVRVIPVSTNLRNFCKQYLVEGETTHLITITAEDIAREREETRQKGNRVFSDKRLEQISLCRKMTSLLLQKYDTLLIHGSCIAIDGLGYLITAPSRTGKSTHMRLWREMFGDRAVMVNDDKPFVKITSEGATAYGSPWRGNHNIGENIAVPLRAICIMDRDITNHITPITAAEAYPIILGQTYRPSTAEAMEKTLILVQRLCEQLEFYSLCCNKEPEAAQMAYEAMKPKDGR